MLDHPENVDLSCRVENLEMPHNLEDQGDPEKRNRLAMEG